MVSLKEEALKYEKTNTLNVADLPKFDVSMDLEKFEGVDQEGKKFSYLYIEDKEHNRYRVPWIVLGQIKEHLEENPGITVFKVKKVGSGLKTQYTVIPCK